MEILLRLGIAVLIILIGVVAYRLWMSLRLSILRRKTKRSVLTGLDDLHTGVPAILYFTTPDCVPCKTIQAPVIESLQAQYGDHLQIVKIDASERSDLADSWGILSVPTTFIIDAQGQPRYVNNGVASAAKLREQLREFAGLSDPSDETVRIGNRLTVEH